MGREVYIIHMQLSESAIEVLHGNWKGAFTIPTQKLYPFQWNWDSGFTSLGWSHFDLKRAILELETLFSGQWENGMIPHIIFHSEKESTYFPNFDFWKAEVNRGAPVKPKTSGITQPPVHGFVLEALINQYPNDEDLLLFARAIYDKVVNSHRFFYSKRDPEREGLAFIFHPWESGRDNSPLWDDSMDRMVIDPGSIPSYTRKDTQLANADERPTTAQYDRYVYLLELGKQYKYDEEAIFHESPFLIQDTLINTILIASNESLIRIGKRLHLDTGEVEEWQSQAKLAFREKLWDEDLSTFLTYDCRADLKIPCIEIGGIAALYGGMADKRQAKLINNYLKGLHQRGYYLCPSFDVDHPRFDSKRYWRGPIWPQMNWLVYQGLKQYDFEETAAIVRGDLLHLVGKLGFYEYFEAQKEVAAQLEHGYGGNHFSWTAACVLDLLKEGGSR